MSFLKTLAGLHIMLLTLISENQKLAPKLFIICWTSQKKCSIKKNYSSMQSWGAHIWESWIPGSNGIFIPEKTKTLQV
jgi:hypothetical protein